MLRKTSSSESDDTDEKKVAAHLRASKDLKEDLVLGFIGEMINQFKYSS